MKDRDYVKIGYSEDVKARFKSLQTGNVYIELIDSKIGSNKDEKALHKLCSDGHYKGEGFVDCPEVRAIGEEYSSPEYANCLNISNRLKQDVENIQKFINQNHLEGYKNWPDNDIKISATVSKEQINELCNNHVNVSAAIVNKWLELIKIINIFRAKNLQKCEFTIDNYKYSLIETSSNKYRINYSFNQTVFIKNDEYKESGNN